MAKIPKMLLPALTLVLAPVTYAQKKTTAPKAAPIKVLKRVNVPAEKVFEHKDFTAVIPAAKTFAPVAYKTQKSAPIEKIPEDLKLKPVDKIAKAIVREKDVSAVPAVKPFEFIADINLKEPQPKTKNLIEISPDEHKMIQAMIFVEYHKRYDLAMPLFVELMENSAFKHQATYQYAETALVEKLYSEFREKMLEAARASKDPAIKRLAIESLVKNMQVLQTSDIEEIEPMVKALDIDTAPYPAYLLKKAKFYSEKGDLKEVEAAVLMIPSEATEYNEATLLKALFDYRRGSPDSAITNLEILWPKVEDNKKDKVRNLAALTLARIYFQKGDYKTALKYFETVHKSSGEWLQAMVEQSWTQILANDNEGAAGNMFTLHTEYFKRTYAPESYVIRTVGYLNLCQYGDGMSVLEDLNRKYKSVHDKLAGFQKNNKTPGAYYELVISFLTNPKQDNYQGVDKAFAMELAHHPSYINIQQQINVYEDEISQFNKTTIDLIRKERETRLEMIKAKNDWAAAQRDPKKSDAAPALESKYLAKYVEHAIFSRARNGIKKVREAAIARITKEENALRQKAAKNLQARYSELVASLKNLVGQQEILAYEIYSGAGEHIRYQMAGGEANKEKQPASVEDKSKYKWKFKGEMWDDEIGHYRSSLKNVCPQENKESI